MSSMMDKYLKEINDAYNDLVSKYGSPYEPKPVLETETPKLTDPKPKSTNVTPWKGSMNMPYDPDVDDLEDYKFK